MLATVTARNIHNYTVFLREPGSLLFSCWEHYGRDLAADAARMADDPMTREWWAICRPCQRRLDTCAPGECWAPMEPVFHHE